jgi:plasmid stabilization system protein ParE
MGEARDDFGAQVRVFTVGAYVIFFRPKLSSVEILAVIHGARDLPAAFRISE